LAASYLADARRVDYALPRCMNATPGRTGRLVADFDARRVTVSLPSEVEFRSRTYILYVTKMIALGDVAPTPGGGRAARAVYHFTG
jgi:hypothetical protein